MNIDKKSLNLLSRGAGFRMAWTAVKEALKPIPSCFVLYLGWGCHLGKGVGGTGGP